MGISNWFKPPPAVRKTIVIDGATYCATVGGRPPTMKLTEMVPGACAVDPPIGTEPPGRMRVGTCDYPNIPGDGTRRNVDLTRFASVLGHATSTDAEQPWPGASGANVSILAVPRTGYIAMAFQVADARRYCNIGASTYHNEPNHPVIASVSAAPGDFNPATALVVSPPRYPGEALLRIVGAPHVNGASCVVGRTYYLNVKFASAVDAFHSLALNNQVGNQP